MINWIKTKTASGNVYRLNTKEYNFSIMKLGNKWVTDAKTDGVGSKWDISWNISSTLKDAKGYVEYFCFC